MKTIFFSILLLLSSSIFASLPKGKEHLKNCIPYEIDSILDAGANNGTDTLELKKVWPKATIYAIEPAPNSFAELKKKVTSEPEIYAYQIALSDKHGKADFYLSENNEEQSSSLLKPTLHLSEFSHVLFKQKIQVETITLDEWAEKEGIDHIGLLWLDLQGAEYKMLSASPKILKTVKAIFTEVNFVELYEGFVIYPVFKRWLESQGFREVFMYPDHRTFGDALFIRK